ncbi:ylmG-like protein 2, chloroplastic [Melia azedarach]|uniref:YlmG-like protein 2, chloroplastic n=1 Tax=Melia azedarach TaxID=155640 RepID=A0ACC1XF48_MELAZ|nr:ylmG-like protein 2, chloroplastic [Melia azedarach]
MKKMSQIESSTERRAKNIVANCTLLSSAFLQTPFVQPFLRPSIERNMVPVASSNVIRDLHNSIVSTTDKFSRFFHSIASQNPVLQKFLSLSSEFHSFCHQVRCRNYVKMNPLLNHNFAAVLPGDSVAGLVVANGVMNFLNIYNTLLVVRLVLTWFPNSPPAIVTPLSTLCDPYLNIFRGIIPPLGGTLDLSPILAFLVLNAFTSAAAALPCELPVAGPASQSSSLSPPTYTNLTSSEKKWMRRLSGNREKSSNGVS